MLFVALATTAPARNESPGRTIRSPRSSTRTSSRSTSRSRPSPRSGSARPTCSGTRRAPPTGTQYWKVDPAKKEKTPLFDHVALAAALSEASKKPLDADTLRLDRVVVAADGKKLTFVFSDNQYEYDLAASKLKPLGKAHRPVQAAR